MPRHLRARSDVPLYLGLGLIAIGLGVGISLIPGRDVFRVLAAGAAALVGLRLVPTTIAEAFSKCRRLIAGLRWWHGLWLAIFASGLVFRVRNIDAAKDTPLDWWAAWRIGLVGLVALVLLRRLASRTPDWTAGLVRGLPAGVFLYGIMALISTSWSAYPLWTLYKAVEYLVDLALLGAVVTAARQVENLKSLFDLTWVLSGLLLLTVWLGIVLQPTLAIITDIGVLGYQIQGVFPAISSNGVGDLGGIVLLISGTRLLFRTHHRGFYWVTMLLGLATLLLAQSRSPLTGTLLGLLAVLLLAGRHRLLALVAVGGILLIVSTGTGSFLEEAFFRGQSRDQFYALSGRLGFWTRAWEVFRDNPLLGLGGYAGGRFVVLGSLGVTDASSLHNAWLEILLGVGLLGFVPFFCTFLGVWHHLLRPPLPNTTHPTVRELRLEALGLFVLICFRSIFSVEFTWHPPLQFFLILGFTELLRRSRGRGPGQAGTVGARVEPFAASRDVGAAQVRDTGAVRE
jgi:O-antigen ligase